MKKLIEFLARKIANREAQLKFDSIVNLDGTEQIITIKMPLEYYRMICHLGFWGINNKEDLAKIVHYYFEKINTKEAE